MGMPNNLVLVRHGQSEGNVAVEAAKKGDLSFYESDEGKFMTVPGRQWRLTNYGREQAQTIGRWLTEELDEGGWDFDRLYTSTYVRARETAAHLGLRGAEWMVSRAFRERDWGDIGSIPRKDFLKRYPDNAHQKVIDPLYWTPPGGESIAHVAENRVRNILSTLHRECDAQNVLAVTHGEMMWAFRMVLEYWSDEDFARYDADPVHKIHNCEVIHYTRTNPFDESVEMAERLCWVRRARPVYEGGRWMVEVDPWQQVDKPIMTNAELMASVNLVPSLF